MNPRNIAINISLAVSGVALWSYGANRLATGGDFDYRPNPLGLKMSPYGQVLAIAAQGAISSDWHGVETAGMGATKRCDHDHSDGSTCSSNGTGPKAAKKVSFIERVELAATEKTNPRPRTSAHTFYLRRQAEDKLRVAYELDPSNYANYNSYHLFLTEPQVGTRPVVNEAVLSLAKATVAYCLREESDPRPALTAAAACCNILQLMFINKADHTLVEMRGHLAVLDLCLARHHQLSAAWMASGTYDNLSVARQQEILDRLSFCSKIRDTSEATIVRLSSTDQAALSR